MEIPWNGTDASWASTFWAANEETDAPRGAVSVELGVPHRISLNVTRHVQRWVDGRSSNFGFQLRGFDLCYYGKAQVHGIDIEDNAEKSDGEWHVWVDINGQWFDLRDHAPGIADAGDEYYATDKDLGSYVIVPNDPSSSIRLHHCPQPCRNSDPG